MELKVFLKKQIENSKHLFFNSSEMAFRYATEVIGGRWPEGEEAISTNAYYSYNYAKDVIKGRFPEGEAAIAKDSYYSCFYAELIIGGRFPEGEKAIANDDLTSYKYAKLINDRFPLGENIIKMKRDYLTSYNNLLKSIGQETI